jgi:hypothetical protein
VPETGVNRPHGAFRHVIRSQAKRRTVRRNDQAVYKGKLPVLRSSAGDMSNTQTGTRSTTTRSLPLSGAAKISVSRSLDANKVDPFGTLPVEEVGTTAVLIRHCEYGRMGRLM